VPLFKHFVKSVIWNSASTSYDFASVREISLNLLLFKPHWVCKIKNKAALNLGSREGVILFLTRNSRTDKGHDFGGNLTYVQIVSQNYVNWPRSTSQYDINFMDTDSAVLKDKFLHSIHILICFAHHWTSQVLSIFNRGHIAFELGKPHNNLHSTHYLWCTNSDFIVRVNFISNISFGRPIRLSHSLCFLFWNHIFYCLVLFLYLKYILWFLS